MKQFIPSEYYCTNPKFNSISKKRAFEKEQARKSIDLTEQFVDIKTSSNDPTLKFVEEPEVVSRS